MEQIKETVGHPNLRVEADSSSIQPFLSALIYGGGSTMKRRILVALALVGLLSLIVVTHAGAATQTTSPVTTFAGEPVGTSTLTRTQSGIAFTLSTSGLEAGHAVTIWWMVIDPDTGAVTVQYAAGHVVGAGGTATFAGFLRVGDTRGVINGGPGLLDALEANVVLVVRDHGELDPSQVNQQILTFDACNPTCTDLQISMHAAG
jgi:hypothetical protein